MEIIHYTKRQLVTNQILHAWIELYKELETDMDPNEDTSYLTEQYFINKLNKGNSFICALEDGSIVGICEIFTISDKERDIRPLLLVSAPAEHLFLGNLIVTKSYRSKGIGTLLIQQAEDYARSIHYSWCGLGVLDSNVRARQLYEHLGYRATHISYQSTCYPIPARSANLKEVDIATLPEEVYQAILPVTTKYTLKRDKELLIQSKSFTAVYSQTYNFTAVGLLKGIPGYMCILAFLAETKRVSQQVTKWMNIVAQYYFQQNRKEKSCSVEYFTKDLQIAKYIIREKSNEGFCGYYMWKSV